MHVSAVDEPAELPEDGEIPSDTAYVSKDVPQIAKHIVSENVDVFAEMPPGLPPDRGVCHTIDTGDAKPVAKPV